MRRAAALLAALLLAAPLPIRAQVPEAAPPRLDAVAGIRVLDQDRLINASRLGQALLADLRAAEAALERDNQAVIDQLAAEERALTEARATLDPDEFRARAEDFDRRVEIIRTERNRLSQELAQRYEAETQRFFETALPVLTRLMEDEGILALIRPELLILGVDWLDITDLAIARLDAATAGTGAASP